MADTLDSRDPRHLTPIAAGESHALARRIGSDLLPRKPAPPSPIKPEVHAWGNGMTGPGQLGDGRQVSSSTPVRVHSTWCRPGLAPSDRDYDEVIAVSAGIRHSLGVTFRGYIFGWGGSPDGQIGDGTNVSRLEPVAVKSNAKFVAVAAGGNYSLGLADDGRLHGWGNNQHGQLGDGTLNTRYLPGVALSAPARESQNPLDRRPAIELKGVKLVAAGYAHSLVILEGGHVRAWGFNRWGQVGQPFEVLPDPTNPMPEDFPTPLPIMLGPAFPLIARSVAGGFSFSVAAAFTGRVYVWGAGLGYVPTEVQGLSRIRYVAAGYGHALALDIDGRVWAWAPGEPPARVPGLSNIVAIAAGTGFSLAAEAEGRVWAWGDNSFGQLGNGTQGPAASSQLPVRVQLEI